MDPDVRRNTKQPDIARTRGPAEPRNVLRVFAEPEEAAAASTERIELATSNLNCSRVVGNGPAADGAASDAARFRRHVRRFRRT